MEEYNYFGRDLPQEWPSRTTFEETFVAQRGEGLGVEEFQRKYTSFI